MMMCHRRCDWYFGHCS